MTRSYGRVYFLAARKIEMEIKPALWCIEAEPHLVIRLKRVFPRISSHEHGTVTITSNHEVCRDLEWFMKRYPLDISASDLKRLRAGSRRHAEALLRLEEIVGTGYEPREFKLAVPARDYQRQAAEVYLERGALLCADDLGLGKTVTAICSFTDPRTLPAVVVTLSGTMPRQWHDQLRKFAPELTAHVVGKRDPYELPKFMGRAPDVLIVNYWKLDGWAEVFAAFARSVVFDECQELRRRQSNRYAAAEHVARAAKFRLGLSATPIYNFGGEIWNVMNVLEENALGSREEFHREWCSGAGADRYGREPMVDDPKALGSYMREHFMLVRRTRSEVRRELPALTRIPQRVQSDRAALDGVKDSAAELARIILAQTEDWKGQRMQAAEELSNVLRQATGIAKAPHVADFIRLLTASGERVLVYCWHRAVYDIVLWKLKDLQPAMFTGSETAAQKQASKDRFEKGETQVMLMSLRAGAGVDGLQNVCRTVVFAELDWSAGVHEQCVGRIYRDGQPDPVVAYFLVADEGADPVIAERLGLKREQCDGIRDPQHDVVEEFQSDPGRAKALAEHYLARLGKTEPANVAEAR